MQDDSTSDLREFACVYLAELVVEALFQADILSFGWCGDVDPETMEVLPPAHVSMHTIEDAVGDFFHHHGDRIAAYALMQLPNASRTTADAAYVRGPIRRDVAHAVSRLCASGGVYRTRVASKGPVTLGANGATLLALSIFELAAEARSAVDDTALEIFRGA